MDREFVKKTLFVFGLVLLLAFTWFARKILLLLFCGLLMALLLTALTEFLQRRIKVPQKLALLIVVLILLSVVGLIGLYLAPGFIEQFGELGQRLPEIAKKQWEAIQQQPLIHDFLSSVPDSKALGSTGSKILSSARTLFSSAADAVASIVFIIFVSLFLSASPAYYKKGVLRLFPPSNRARAEHLLNKSICVLRYWILGQLIDMAAVGILVGIGLKLLGVPLPGAVGVLSGFFEFVPFLGPVLSSVPGCLLALSISPAKALATAGLFLGVQLAENHLLVPLVQQKTVDLPPVLTLVAILLFGSAFGVLGMLLATPITAVGFAIIQERYAEGKQPFGPKARHD
jgi:predicted PurR-regulated permease PerM